MLVLKKSYIAVPCADIYCSAKFQVKCTMFLVHYIHFFLGNFAQKSGCVWYMSNEFPLSSFTTGIGICSLNFTC
jgi:hypothetical protein